MPIITVSRNCRQFVLNKYPSLADNPPLARLFHYLCFGSFFDPDSHQLVIPTKTISEEFFKQPYTSAFNGKAVLEDFRQQVLPDLRWTGHSRVSPDSWHGKAREIVDLGFDAEMQRAVRQECLSPSEDQVDFVTGESRQRKDRYRATAGETAQYEKELAEASLNATQSKILSYLRELNAGHIFLRKLGENQAAIKVAIDGLPPALQDTRYRILAAVRSNPNVYYLPSARERTCRLSARGDSLLGLKKVVRQAATKGWWEADLRSSQFAILAAKLQAPISQAFIASGKSLWREFYQHLYGIDADPATEVKKVFKEAVYSICFGKGEEGLKELLARHGMQRLLEHPILSELLSLRGRWFDEIKKDAGACDVWGQWQAVENSLDSQTGKSKRWAGAVAASVIQSVEMEIISPVFDVAARSGEPDQFRIVLFQHDGCTISFNAKDKIERAQGKLKRAVEDRAKALGVSTVLEFTQL